MLRNPLGKSCLHTRPKTPFSSKSLFLPFDLKAERTSPAWKLLQFCDKQGTKTENLEFKGPKGKSYSSQINIWALHHLIYRPVPCLLQLCHNCWQNCQHHPGLQIGVFHVWVFLNHALCPFFYTIQSTHPCFQWVHHHPIQKRGEKRKIDIKQNSNNNLKWILQNYSTSVKMSAFCVPQNECHNNIPQVQATLQNKLQCIVTLGHIGHQAPLYKFAL